MKRWKQFGLCMLVAVAGCATSGGMSDEDQIMAIVGEWTTAVETKDLSVVEARYSDSYIDANASSKEAAMENVQGLIDQGVLENAKISTASAKLSFDGNKATYAPLDFTSDAGGATIEMYFTKESGGWMISRVDAY